MSPSQAATTTTPYVPTRIDSPNSPPVTGNRWGERLVSAALPGPLGGNPVTSGDINGDGVNDFWTAAPFEAVGSVTNQGRVYAVSGKTLRVLYTVNAPVVTANLGASFGFYISTPGDVTGDGIPDFVSGTDAQRVAVQPGLGGCTNPATAEPNGCNEGQGQAWVFNGATGVMLYSLSNPSAQGSGSNSARFGSRIGRAGDINADGVADIIVGASNQDVCNTQACTDAVTAAQGTAGTQANAGNLACGDVSPVPNGCGKNQGQAFIFNGATGALLRTLNSPDPVSTASTSCLVNCATFGVAVQGPGDINADGVADQLVDAGNLTVGSAVGVGRAYLFSGANGSLLARIDDPLPENGVVFGFQDAAPLSPGDVSGDGVPDLYANGFVQSGPTGEGQGKAWIFNGATTVTAGTGQLLVTVDDPSPETGGQFGWSMATTDYNKDGRADFYVGQSPHHVAGATGSGGSYVFNGLTSASTGTSQLLKALELPVDDRQTSTGSNLGPNLGWGLAAPGDLDGDSEPDYLGGAPFEDVKGVVNQGQIFAFQSRERPPAADFDGNTTSDVSVFRPSDGTWYVRGGGNVPFGTSGDAPVQADYDGDGNADIAVYRPGTGTWFFQNSSNGTFTAFTYGGIAGDVPVPGDFDGDGKADVAIYRPSVGTWYVHKSSNGTDTATTFGGVGGDIPVVGDYDGDAKADLAIFRPSGGVWHVLQSSNGVSTALGYGTSGDIPVPADYDGDTRTDIAIFRPSTGLWSIHPSSGGADTAVTYGGIGGDVPTPGDFDGDGRADIGIYRPFAGTWYVHRTTDNGDTLTNFGIGSDIPLELPYAIRRVFFP